MKSKKRAEDELEQAQILPIHPRLAVQMGRGTIRSLVDAIVELVTNCDDSYKRLEAKGLKVNGNITIRIERLKGNKCRKLEVIDLAEGMDKENLREALIFASESSGFQEGKSVRGFFGRGLKEAILALGKGEIYTVKNNGLSRAILWRERNKPMFRPPKQSHTPSQEQRKEIGLLKGNGTVVKIEVTNDKINCPLLKTLHPQIRNHYALRDINSANNRKIKLEIQSLGMRSLKESIKVSYIAPKGKERFNRVVKLPKYEDKIKITVYESEQELESPYHNPCARAGLLIKTDGAILDNQLFRYQAERAGRFFFGEIVWPDLARRLRAEESLLDLNRGGIEWQQEICLILQNEVERILETFVEEKKKQLAKPSGPPSAKIGRLNKTMCSLLNKLAREHLSELPPGPEPGENIEDLTIKPAYANLPINIIRTLSVYAPLTILSKGTWGGKVKVESNNAPHIIVLNPNVALTPHRKYPLLCYGYFRVVGKTDSEEAIITCILQNHMATAHVRVAPQKQRPERPDEPKGGRGRYFREIKADTSQNPEQRVRYEEKPRTIWICVNFPGVKRHFKNNLDLKRDESKLMYAELIGEAFCKFAARYDIDKGNIPVMSDSRDAVIEAYIKAMNNSQKKCLHLIHDAVLKHKL